MKIAHVVTLVSADGAYGGPVAAAAAQCEALAELGNDVTLFAGWDGRGALRIPGVDVRLFKVRRWIPGRGFAGLHARGLTRHVESREQSFDLLHVHLARDLVTLPVARSRVRRGERLVVQTHGMVLPDTRLRARLLDLFLTRAVVRAAAVQLVLTDEEQSLAQQVARAPVAVARVRNGVRESRLRAVWTDSVPEVVYCARLHERKRPHEFVRMAAELLRRGLNASFTIIGPDGGELAEVTRLISALGVSRHVTYAGALEPSAVLHRLAQAQVYVLPSIREPFPMSVLEAMSVGLPCVITESTGISGELGLLGAAAVTNGSADAMADAVQHLVSGQHAWSEASERARAAILSQFSAHAVGVALDVLYRAILEDSPRMEADGSVRSIDATTRRGTQR